MIYLLTAIGLSPGGSITVHIYTHTHTHTQYIKNTNNNRTTQITTNLEEWGPCPVFANFTLAFALQLRKKHGKTSIRLRKTSVRVQYTYYQNTHTLQNLRARASAHTHTRPHKHTRPHTHTHTLRNNIKPPQCKLKQTQCKIYRK